MTYWRHCYDPVGRQHSGEMGFCFTGYVLSQRPLYGTLPPTVRIHLNQGMAVGVSLFTLRIFLPLPKNFDCCWCGDICPQEENVSFRRCNGSSKLEDEAINWSFGVPYTTETKSKNGVICWLEWLILITKGKLACLFYTMEARRTAWSPKDFLGIVLVLACLVLRIVKN